MKELRQYVKYTKMQQILSISIDLFVRILYFYLEKTFLIRGFNLDVYVVVVYICKEICINSESALRLAVKLHQL